EKDSHLQYLMLRFLEESSRARLQLMGLPTNFDTTSRAYEPLYYARRESYDTITDPIAAFVLSQLDRFHESNRSERARKQFVPIVVCSQAGCGNFSVMQRKGKRNFFSDLYRMHHYSQEYNRDPE